MELLENRKDSEKSKRENRSDWKKMLHELWCQIPPLSHSFTTRQIRQSSGIQGLIGNFTKLSKRFGSDQ